MLDLDSVVQCSLTRCYPKWLEEMNNDPEKDFLVKGLACGFELMSGFDRMVGADCSDYRIGAVAKSDSATPRPITNCGRPFGNSSNSYITPEPSKFEKIDFVLQLSKRGWYYAVIDIDSAYRHVPNFPDHRTLQGFP